MIKKIPKLIICGVITTPTIIVLACNNESFLIKDKDKRKNIITKIIIPDKDDKKHDAKLFGAIDLARKKAIKAINDAKTIANAIKAAKNGVDNLNKAIKNYNDSKGTEHKFLQVDKAKFSSFDRFIVGKVIPILKDGPTIAKELTALTGHGNMPAGTPGVIRTFTIKTNTIKKIATITITFTTRTLTDTTTYKIYGFERVNINVKNGFMYQTKDNTIYIGTRDKGLKKLEGNTLTHVNSIDVGNGFMYQTKDGTIYVGTKSEGLKKLVNDGKGGKRLELVVPNRVKYGFMYQTKVGTIYVETLDEGIRQLVNDGKGGKKLTEVSFGSVISSFVYQTKEDTIYVGAYEKGLKKLVDDGAGGKRLDLVDTTNVLFMYQTKDGTIYVGTYEKGLKKLEGDTLVSVNDINVYGGFMYQTKDDTIYVGTHDKGLKKLEGNVLTDVNSTNVIGGFMYQTKDGTIYIGTQSEGLKKIS